MKKYKQKQKTIISSFFLMIYAFIVFFSGILHQHDSHSEISQFSTDKAVKIFKNSNEDCLAFHLSHNQKTIVDTGFDFEFLSIQFQNNIVDFQQYFSVSEGIFYFSLRAPPVFI